MTPAVIEPSEVMPAPRRPMRPPERRRRRRRDREAYDGGPVNVGLWIPTTLLFALLAPLALLVLPFLYLAPRHVIPSPARTIAVLGAVLLSMGGTVVEVDAPDCRIRLRLF
jgi:hypothetical protein